jgi:hypothetical protein
VALLFPAHRFAEQFARSGELEFLFDRRAVGVNGLEIDAEVLGDLLVSLPWPKSWNTSNSRLLSKPKSDSLTEGAPPTNVSALIRR